MLPANYYAVFDIDSIGQSEKLHQDIVPLSASFLRLSDHVE